MFRVPDPGKGFYPGLTRTPVHGVLSHGWTQHTPSPTPPLRQYEHFIRITHRHVVGCTSLTSGLKGPCKDRSEDERAYVPCAHMYGLILVHVGQTQSHRDDMCVCGVHGSRDVEVPMGGDPGSRFNRLCVCAVSTRGLRRCKLLSVPLFFPVLCSARFLSAYIREV